MSLSYVINVGQGYDTLAATSDSVPPPLYAVLPDDPPPLSDATRIQLAEMCVNLFYARMVRSHNMDAVSFKAEFEDFPVEYVLETHDLIFCFRNVAETARLIMDPATTSLPRDCIVFDKRKPLLPVENPTESPVSDAPVPGS